MLFAMTSRVPVSFVSTNDHRNIIHFQAPVSKTSMMKMYIIQCLIDGSIFKALEPGLAELGNVGIVL